MSDSRKEYDVNIGGVSHTMLLDEADAIRYGATLVAEKSRAPENKSRAVDNKARTPINKGA